MNDRSTAPGASVLHLPRAERRRIEAWARADYPREACGLLIGVRDGRGASVRRAVRARNLNTDRARDRYDLDPSDHLRAEKEARELGLEVVAIWHSHPDHPAEPSETDRAGAWEGWSYLIASVDAAGTGDLRSWRLSGAAFDEEELRS